MDVRSRNTVVGREAEAPHLPVKMVDEVAMLDHHPLRRTRGAGGVDDIGQMIGAQTFDDRIVIRLQVRARQQRIEIEMRHASQRFVTQCTSPVLVRHEQARAGIMQDQAQAIRRIGRIKRHVGTTGLEDRQQTHEHPGTALHAQRHAIIRPDTHGDQFVGDTIGRRIQRGIRHPCMARN